MFCVIYEFTVAPANEAAFKDLWHQLTLRICEESGSLGSRLHKVIETEDTWVAYAQWPSEKIYNSLQEHVSYTKLREQFLKTCQGIKILYQMECIDDLFLNKM